MPTLEGRQVAKWRKSLGLTQQELAQSCPERVDKNWIHDVERRENSRTVETLLNIIRGLERASGVPLGTTDRRRLETFFAGPDLHDARQRLASSARETAALADSE